MDCGVPILVTGVASPSDRNALLLCLAVTVPHSHRELAGYGSHAKEPPPAVSHRAAACSASDVAGPQATARCPAPPGAQGARTTPNA